MKNIIISAAKGSGPSIVKAMAIGKVLFDAGTGYCHDSWDHARTSAGDRITFTHDYHVPKNQHDVIIGITINPKNILQIVHRCVMVDFEYADNQVWIDNDWSWTPAFHSRVAGPDWPSYSKDITAYPQWCRNELCQFAWEKVSPWTKVNAQHDLVIDSAELFDLEPPVTLTDSLTKIGCGLDSEFLQNWSQRNRQIWHNQKELFSWQVPNA